MKEASLGIVWANAVNTRIMMSRTGRRRRVLKESIADVSRKRLKRLESRVPQEDSCDQEQPQRPAGELGDVEDMLGIEVDESTPTLIRRFHVVFSPFAPPSTIDYIITPSGVHTLEGTRKITDLASVDRARRKRDAMRAAIDEEEWSTGLVGPDHGDSGHDHGEAARGREGEEVFDDLGQLPAEFWDEKLDDEGDDDEE